ncbi:MAG: retaining beta-glycosidase, partial [Verrucomicrobiales bacterium]|nr:retaining beta-glycosidase [Verrucomicrobiales bacterium]
MKILVTMTLLFLLSGSGRAEEAQVKMAGAARLDIVADAAVGKLESGELNAKGEVTRANWLAPERIPGSYSVQIPISHFAWKELIFSFTPEHDGQVTITLLGPWEPSPDGNLFKE